MKLKLDENLGEKARALLEAAGHDVSTVPLENLQAAPDQQLIQPLERETLSSRLWTIEIGRVRIHQNDTTDAD